MTKPVNTVPPLPYPGGRDDNRSLAAFDQDLVKALQIYLGELARRANLSLPKDGSEPMTGPLNLGGFVLRFTGTSVNYDEMWVDDSTNTYYLIVDGATTQSTDTGSTALNTGKLRLTNAGDISSASSTNHGLQIGPDNGVHVAFDTNEIQARNNGAVNALGLQNIGGDLNVGLAGSVYDLMLNHGHLTFPAAHNPSTNVNTLDDYEEGTWTPTLAFGGASTGITYTTQQGTYVKIGKVVHFQFRLIISSKGTATGNAAILGLPFSSDNYHPVTFGYGTNFTGLTGVVTGYMENNSANITLRQSSATGVGPILTDTVFTATTDMIIGGSYIATA